MPILLQSNLPKLFNADGLCIWPFIFVKNKDDKPLIAHEMVHYREQLPMLVVGWWLLYLIWPTFRLRAEVRAYKESIRAGTPIHWCAYWLSTNYRLNLTQDEAVELLKG